MSPLRTILALGLWCIAERATADQGDRVVNLIPANLDEADPSTFVRGRIAGHEYLAIHVEDHDDATDERRPHLVIARVDKYGIYVPLAVLDEAVHIDAEFKGDTIILTERYAHAGVISSFVFRFRHRNGSFPLERLDRYWLGPHSNRNKDDKIEYWSGEAVDVSAGKVTYWQTSFDLKTTGGKKACERALKIFDRAMPTGRVVRRTLPLKPGRQWALERLDWWVIDEELPVAYFDGEARFHVERN